MGLFSLKADKQNKYQEHTTQKVTTKLQSNTPKPQNKPVITLPPEPGVNSMFQLYKKLNRLPNRDSLKNPFKVEDFNMWIASTSKDVDNSIDLLVYKSGKEFTTPNYTRLKNTLFSTDIKTILGIPEFINKYSTENITLTDVILYGIYTPTKDFDAKRLNMYNLVHNLDIPIQVIISVPLRRYSSVVGKVLDIPYYKTHNPDILSFLEMYKLCKYFELGKKIQELPEEDGYAPYLYPEHNKFIDKVLSLYAMYQETIQQYNSLSEYIDQNKTDMSQTVLKTLQDEKKKLNTNIDTGLTSEYLKYLNEIRAFNTILTEQAKEQAQARKDKKHLSILTTLGIKD